MRILFVISSLNPIYGGPVSGLIGLSCSLESLGIKVEILSLDDPANDFLNNLPVLTHAIGPSKTNYRYSSALKPWLRQHVNDYDCLIINGLWEYVGFAVRSVCVKNQVPYYLYAHGMLGPWFKFNHPIKHIKKLFYWLFFERFVLRDSRRVFFTCEEERRLASGSFPLYRCKEYVTGFGTSPSINSASISTFFFQNFPTLQSRRIILFLGRVCEIKGVDLLIDAVSRIENFEDYVVVLAGPVDESYSQLLLENIQTLDIKERFFWTGMLSGDMKWAALHACDVFCLPSHHENFGMVVAEALACSKPVLISNKVNIWREIESDKAGFVANDDVDGVFMNLQSWLSLSYSEKEDMRKFARLSFETNFLIDNAAKNIIDLVGVD